MTAPGRRYQAGQSLEDYCRACKNDRLHTIIVVDGDGQPIRVSCGYCHSEHNYRGGPRVAPSGGGAFRDPKSPGGGAAVREPGSPGAAAARPAGDRRDEPRAFPRAPSSSGSRSSHSAKDPFPIVSDRERTAPPMTLDGDTDIELLLRRIIREEAGITPVAPADKWRGGTFILRPGTPGLQEKSWPIETFFHKVVMLRNRLRTLEQQVNAADLPDDVKLRLQGYISGCYGTLTSFNVLFADEEDQFKGSGGD
jgi:hypothetical protein